MATHAFDLPKRRVCWQRRVCIIHLWFEGVTPPINAIVIPPALSSKHMQHQLKYYGLRMVGSPYGWLPPGLPGALGAPGDPGWLKSTKGGEPPGEPQGAQNP